MLTTLLPIGEGWAMVAGADVGREPKAVRRGIGYVGPLGGADLQATGHENPLLQGQLYGGTKAEVIARAEELIDAFQLREFVDRQAEPGRAGNDVAWKWRSA